MIYKGKAVIWGVMLAITLLITWVSSWNVFNRTEYTSFVDTEYQQIKNFSDIDTGRASVRKAPSMQEAEIIIKDSSETEMDGYIKYPGEFFSPIGILVPKRASSEHSGFEKTSKTDGFDSIYEISINLKTILEAMEKDKTWGALNFDKKVFDKDEKVSLAIPDNSFPYYEQVKMLIRTALNDYKAEGLNSAELEQRTDAVIKKCKKYSDGPGSFAEKQVNQNEKSLVPILAPEFMFAAGGDYLYTSRDHNDRYILITLAKTYCIMFDMFVKENSDNDHYKDFMESLEGKAYYEDTGLRNRRSDFWPSTTWMYNYCVKNISEIQIAPIDGSASPDVNQTGSTQIAVPATDWRQALK